MFQQLALELEVRLLKHVIQSSRMYIKIHQILQIVSELPQCGGYLNLGV
jgi:hypothetical protein